MLSRFDEFLFRGALWFLEYHNVLLYADKRILSGVKIQEVGLCSSFSQQRHYSEVYEKLVPTRQRPGAKKNFRLLLPSMDARPNPLGSCDIISLAGSTDYGCSVYGLFSNIHISKCFWVFLVAFSVDILSLCLPSPLVLDFTLFSHLSNQTLSFLDIFKRNVYLGLSYDFGRKEFGIYLDNMRPRFVSNNTYINTQKSG